MLAISFSVVCILGLSQSEEEVVEPERERIQPIPLSEIDLDSLENCVIENEPRDVNVPLVLEPGQSYVNTATGDYIILMDE